EGLVTGVQTCALPIWTAEGVVFYRMRDLRLERDCSPALARSWIVMHTIDESSPLHDATPETLARDEVELLLTVVGIDETSAQNQIGRASCRDRWSTHG